MTKCDAGGADNEWPQPVRGDCRLWSGPRGTPSGWWSQSLGVCLTPKPLPEARGPLCLVGVSACTSHGIESPVSREGVSCPLAFSSGASACRR